MLFKPRRPRPDKREKISPQITHLALFGGFLGSGKTTLIVELGKILIDRGHSVAIVTNDQGEFLVDSWFARCSGFVTAEVLNGCLCCRFSNFIECVTYLTENTDAEYIFAEPVGSCTDLRATVMAPVLAYHREKFLLRPLMIVVDAFRLAGKFSSMDLENPVEPAEILIGHQMREADVLLVSKKDMIKDGAVQTRGIERLRRLNPDARILSYSIRSGEGLEEIADIVTTEQAEPRASVDLDYSSYAEAEAQYGWYNGTWDLLCKKGMNLEEIAGSLLSGLVTQDEAEGLTHAKLQVVWEQGAFKLSSVSGLLQVDGQPPFENRPELAKFTLNIRALMDPEELKRRVDFLLNRTLLQIGGTMQGYRMQTLIPSSPNPEMRLCGLEGEPFGNHGIAGGCGNPACAQGCMHARDR